MPKRFTDTDKWRKPFIRSLQAPYKLLWFYIVDDCDHSGIWIVDFEVAQIRIGEKVSQEQALILFKDKIVVFDNSERWFIPDFVEFQYGTLNENNRAHNSVINTLTRFNLLKGNKVLTSPLQGAKEKEKDKDKDKEKDKDKVIIFPFTSDEFMTWWAHWKEYKSKDHRFKYKSAVSEQAALKELAKISSGVESVAIATIEHTIANGWKGFILPKNENKLTASSIQDGLEYFRKKKESGDYK